MPEFLAVGLVGAVVTFLVVNWNLYWVHRGFHRPEVVTLNHNLSKVSRYWSLEQGRILEVNPPLTQEDYARKDYQKATRSAFIFGTMMIFLSWLGLLIFIVYFVSTNKLAKSHKEIRIFESPLVQNREMEPGEIQKNLLEAESLG
jgi:hypothetical protein